MSSISKKVFVLLVILLVIDARKFFSLKIVEIQKSEIHEFRKARMFLMSKLKNLIMPNNHHKKHHSPEFDNYTLYLAVKNFGRKLYAFETKIEKILLEKYENIIGDRYGLRKFKLILKGVKKIIRDSIIDNYMFVGKHWKINLSNLLLIQNNPYDAITYLANYGNRGNHGNNGNRNKSN